jgi:hypothetical protein
LKLQYVGIEICACDRLSWLCVHLFWISILLVQSCILAIVLFWWAINLLCFLIAVFIAIEMRLNENSHYSSVIFQKMCHLSCAERHISSFLTEYVFSVMSILQICLRIQKPVTKFYQMPSWNGRWGNFSTFFCINVSTCLFSFNFWCLLYSIPNNSKKVRNR